MAGSPKWKVYTSAGRYEGCTKHAETAAALAASLGEGATVRYEHGRILWREGSESFPAGESYDRAAAVMIERLPWTTG